MTPEPLLALAASPRDWAQRLHRHISEHGGAHIRVTVLTASEALDEHYEILVADERTSFLSARAVARLQQQGKRVLGLYDPVDPRAKGDLLDWGVDDVVACDAPIDDILTLAHRLAPARHSEPLATPPSQSNTTEFAVPPSPTVAPSAMGRVAVVQGAGAGCGRTEVALALASQLSRQGGSTILVELDEAVAALAPRLGLAPYPNLRAAVDWWRQGRFAGAAIQGVNQHLGVIVAGPLPRPLAPLAPDDVLGLIDDLATQASWLVVDAGANHCLPTGVQVAGVLVASGCPVGALRLRTALRHHARRPPHVVINQAPDDAYRRWELIEDLTRTADVASVVTVPHDRHVARAVWQGRPVTRGPFNRQLALLADRLAQQVGAP